MTERTDDNWLDTLRKNRVPTENETTWAQTARKMQERLEARQREVATPEFQERERLRKEADELAAREAERIRAEREKVSRERAFANSNFPLRCKKFITESLAAGREIKWPKPGVYDRLRDNIADGLCSVLLGDSGPGKTTMAALASRWWMTERGGKAQYAKAADLVGDFRHSCYGEQATKEAEWLRAYSSADTLLVIDEYDKRAETDRSADMVLLRLLDKRYDAMAPTVLISNLNPAMWEAAVDRSLQSRLAQWGHKLICDWPSFRTTPGAAQ